MNKYHLTPLQILSLYNELELPDKFCIVPFSNVIFNPSGDISICRQKGTKHIVGSLDANTIEEIWNNEYMQQWRKEFLTGNINICKNEIRNDSCHISSGSYFFIKDVSIDILQKDLPLKITANFNGKCNLRCKMCDVWTLENGYYDKIGYWDKLRTDFFPHIKEIELLSGEPFVQNDTWKLISELSAVNNDCVWSFTTNGHWKLTDKIRESLEKIIIKNIIYSVDSFHEDKYSEIRVGGRLDVVLKNIESLVSYNETRSQKIALCLHFLVMKDNWAELSNVLRFCDKYQIMLTVNTLNEPECYSVMNSSQKEKEKILDFLLGLDKDDLKRLMRVYLSVLSGMNEIDKSYFMSVAREKLRDEL